MNSIERNTCLKFQRRQKESDYLTIQNKANEGCYSLVGRDKGPQVLMLESSNVATCIAYQIVVHELLHVSGLWHEQMRSDRDSYLKINYNNIDSWSYPQFAKVSASEATTYNVPYDYKSIMHYDKTAFAKRAGLITMQTKDKSMQDVIGKMSDVSKYDYFKVCSIYNCKTCMNDNNWKNLLKKKKKVKGQDGEEFDINQDLTSTTKEVISNLNEGISPKVTTIPPVNATKLIIPNQDKETCGDLFPNVCRSLLGDSESPKTICKMFGPVLDSWCCKSCKVAIN
uniref:Metalloendopeptidase n=1 Tax=Rhabditophanes sp. KR3021 TaxID=114890 RepID=A0AC35TS05_9BILA